MPEKKVEVKVDTDVNMEKVKSLESTIQQLKKQKLELDINTRTQELEETERRIESLKIFLDTVNSGNTNIHIDDSEIKKAEAELEQLESEKIDLEIALESDKLDAVKVEIEDLDGTRVNIDLDNSTALQAIDQISQGFSRLKEGVFEIKDAFSEILSSAGSQEMNKTFLEMNLGAEGAKSALQDINSIVANLPGDDTALQGLLSQATAKNAGITRNELEGMAVAATDYFSAMSFYGKSATEAQQDMTNYILAGNTAELERSPILQGHIDKLKEGTTIQERSQLLQEALNEAGWGGISQQDTYNNKLETFNGMLERGRYNLGGMFQEGAKGAMDFALGLDDATNGMVGIGFALLDFASPLTDSVMGLGQMATGFKAIKDLGFKELELVTKLSAAADWLLSAAQTVLNLVMSMNPIVLVVLALVALAAALVWAYYNVDWFREMVDNAWASLVQFGQAIYSHIQPAIQWLSDLFNQFTSQLGLNTNDWLQAILGFILFIPNLPAQLSIAFINAIASTLGFGDNFVQTMWSTAVNAVTGFITYIATLPGRVYTYLSNLLSRANSWGSSLVSSFFSTASRSVSNFITQISSLPGKLAGELQRMYSTVNTWAATLPQKFWDAGVNAVKNFLNALGIHSPGFMQVALLGELEDTGKRIPSVSGAMISNIGRVGEDIITAFGEPDLNIGSVSAGSGSGVSVGGDTVINVYGNVDSDDRVREIVEVVRRELSWNNATAGRTI